MTQCRETMRLRTAGPPRAGNRPSGNERSKRMAMAEMVNDCRKNRITTDDYEVKEERMLGEGRITKVLSYAAHASDLRKSVALALNNLARLAILDIDTIVIVYSSPGGDMDAKAFADVVVEKMSRNVVVIEDKTNLYYDFGKHAIAHLYLRSASVALQHVHLMNDSIIITGELDDICRRMNQCTCHYDLVGALESHEISRHYQSWWLALRGEVIDDYFSQLVLVRCGSSAQVGCTIHVNEVALCGRMIHKYDATALVTTAARGNPFHAAGAYADMYGRQGLRVVKKKCLTPEFRHLAPWAMQAGMIQALSKLI